MGKPVQKLTDKHKAFVREYLKDQNATQAYIRAGYSSQGAESSASTLLRIPKVKDAVTTGLAKLAERANITALKNIQRIAEIAYEDPFAKKCDILKACELIGKTIGQFTDKVDATVNANVTAVDSKQVKELREEIIAKLKG